MSDTWLDPSSAEFQAMVAQAKDARTGGQDVSPEGRQTLASAEARGGATTGTRPETSAAPVDQPDAERLRRAAGDSEKAADWWRMQAESPHNSASEKRARDFAALLTRAAERAESTADGVPCLMCRAKCVPMCGACGEKMRERSASSRAVIDAAMRAEQRATPWLACEFGESTRRGEFELRVFPSDGVWWWRVDWRPVSGWARLPVTVSTAGTLAAAKAAALAVGGWL